MADDDDALLTALTTDHFVLQSARGTISSEAAARSTLYVGAVSSSLVALGFATNLAGDAFGVFVGTVLPALIVLGEFTFVRLSEIGVEDMRYLRQIQRIRRHYGTLHPAAGRFFPTGDDSDDGTYAALFQSMGISKRPSLQALFTAATAVAGINGVVTGAAIVLLIRWIGAPLPVAAVAGIIVAAVFVTVHVVWVHRRYAAGLTDL